MHPSDIELRPQPYRGALNVDEVFPKHLVIYRVSPLKGRTSATTGPGHHKYTTLCSGGIKGDEEPAVRFNSPHEAIEAYKKEAADFLSDASQVFLRCEPQLKCEFIDGALGYWVYSRLSYL